MIDLRDALIDHRLRVAGDGDFALQNLSEELLYQILAALLGGGLLAETALFDNLIQKTRFGGRG